MAIVKTTNGKVMKHLTLFVLVLSVLLVCACNNTDSSSVPSTELTPTSRSASVTAVTFTGEPGQYTFIVTIESPDTGCTQYADWWEVLKPDGDLVFRRILAHSHVNEQPFRRSGGPVSISTEEDVLVRAHMNNNGYGEQVFSGNIEEGFMQDTSSSSFAENLEVVDPLPVDCAF